MRNVFSFFSSSFFLRLERHRTNTNMYASSKNIRLLFYLLATFEVNFIPQIGRCSRFFSFFLLFCAKRQLNLTTQSTQSLCDKQRTRT